MKLLLVAGALGASMAFGVVEPSSLWNVYRELYPADPLQRQALNECFTEDAQFNRLDPNAREACYRHNLATPSSRSRERPVQPPNFVDLWKAAGQGHLPQNDVRAEQANDRFLHPAGARVIR